ncbi:MAG TPA: magnesium transporter CorA family protein [Candidatus Kapabacteria bacterium]|nr:magnesium transporter CorA family protein [Candidatus Kapabacteria bacterium]
MVSYLKTENGLVTCTKWEAKCWINVEEPTLDDKKYLLEEISIPDSYFNDIEDVDERPRIEYEDGWFLVLMRVPIKHDEKNNIPYSTVPIGIIFNEDHLVTICFYKTDMLQDFIAFTQRKKINISSNFEFVFRLLLSSSVWFLKFLKQINQNIKLAEYQLEKSIKNEDLQTLLQIEKSLVYFTTSLKGNDILIYRLKNLKVFKEDYDEELIEDAEIELKQALETTNIFSDILSGMMDAYASVISNNLNQIMKILTSFSLILMIPTLIASFYGMNVPSGWEEFQYGFIVILLLSVSASSLVAFYFRKKNWF